MYLLKSLGKKFLFLVGMGWTDKEAPLQPSPLRVEPETCTGVHSKWKAM